MAKIDEIKELLNTLRVTMTIAFGILVIVVGSIIKRYDASKIDAIFWVGVVFTFILLIFIVFIVRKISEKTKEIKDL
jgi:glucan phosphoethanolaminetransferase (alkaline phosphatase superfamily)